MASNQLWISMNGLLVGELFKKKSGALQFQYADEWLSSAFSRSLSLSLPLSKKVYEGDVLFNFLDNLLPDNEAIRAKMQARFHTATIQPFDLLAAVGKDCVGAIQLSSDIEKPLQVIKAKLLTETEIAHLLKGYATVPLGMQDSDDDFRISIAGAQEKTALLKVGDQWCLPKGATPTSHILKLPIGVLTHNNLDLSQSCENEWLCMEIARAFGLPVANAEVLSFDGEKVLAVERFDRKWLSADKLIRLPQEDMCQALGIAPALKYEADGGPGIKAIMDILRGSQKAQEDRAVFFKAQILFWLLAAPDGHGKNFSLFIEANNAYRLTPLYDILSAYPFMGGTGLQKQKVKMAMALQGKTKHFKWDSIVPRHFVSTAKALGYSETLAFDHFKQMMEKTDSVLETIKTNFPAGFPIEISEPILNGLKQKSQLGLRFIESIETNKTS
ncbi:type II toxin-antitoxin system HipA family toxin [Thiomicrorhabdus sp. Milos-T2]|uniref:type II toxin-antitoxin system HipA family toxin n=1 Tax=Thiomicrorhabdus sp. Milos-T2 TaxID=90814 RepID=UPI000570C033|nr:type II toxin-antitoxin system HipA family toxin [Thiomicrorhabdus sp. Milos-T2]